MRIASTACVLALMAATAPALAQPATPASAAPARSSQAYSSGTTQLGTLLADPAAKAVLAKHVPSLISRAPDLEQASGMTLKEMQEALRPYSPDTLSDKVLAAIDEDLAKLPAKK